MPAGNALKMSNALDADASFHHYLFSDFFGQVLQFHDLH